ncbi:MAG: hypothetical protein J6A79_09750 [Clostridia bacterium]|nr:hypothetical protein [Clostridia bacterium]
MRRETISMALNALDDRYISEAAFRPASCQKIHAKNRGRRRLLSLALAAALLLSLGIVACAANLFGLRELYANPNRGEMPAEAAKHIMPQDAEAAGDGWHARVLESYCDENTVLVTVQVSADEGYFVVPADEDPDSPLGVIGLAGEGTLGEYARREGKTLLFAEAALEREALGLCSAGMRFESISPQEMTIYFEGARSGGKTGAIETICTVLVAAWPPEADAAEVERRALSFTLEEADAAWEVYAPADPLAVPGVKLGELRLTRTPLGISLRLEMKLRDKKAAEELLTLRLMGVEFHGSGILAPDGESVFSQGEGEYGESPTLQFLNWDKEILAEVVFKKTK